MNLSLHSIDAVAQVLVARTDATYEALRYLVTPIANALHVLLQKSQLSLFKKEKLENWPVVVKNGFDGGTLSLVFQVGPSPFTLKMGVLIPRSQKAGGRAGRKLDHADEDGWSVSKPSYHSEKLPTLVIAFFPNEQFHQSVDGKSVVSVAAFYSQQKEEGRTHSAFICWSDSRRL